MAKVTTYDKQLTALLVIDPYNDFISDGGKIWDRLKAVAEANRCVPHTLQVLNAARAAGLRVFYALHHRYHPGDYETWTYIAPIQKAAWSHKVFEAGTWGGEIRDEFAPQPGDIVSLEHWCSSSFANTDLDLLLKKNGIHQLIVIGLIARLRGQRDARRSRRQSPELRQRHRQHRGDRGFDLGARELGRAHRALPCKRGIER